MFRSGFFSSSILLFTVILAGCSRSDSLSPPKYNYGGSVDLQGVASQFLADPAANRTVSDGVMPLTFLDLEGNKVDLATFRGKSNVLLVVTKGMPQYPGGVFCPGCLAQMNSLVANHDDFKKRQTEVLVVFPGPGEKAGEFLTIAKAREAEKPSPVPLLLDADLVAVNALGIRADFAKPATYILDRKGNVVYAYVGESTTDRPSVKSLLSQLDKLNAKK